MPPGTGTRAGAPGDPWIESLAWLMDSSIPIGRWSIGLDGLLGLVPGIGDLAGTIISMMIISRAAAAGVPRIAIARMVANVAIDSVAGSIPFLGDAFDFAYKANMKNLRIYQQSMESHGGARARHWGFFALLALVLLALAAIPVAVLVTLFRQF